MLAALLAEKDAATPQEKEESLILARAAVQIDPGNLQHAEVLALALMVNGHNSEAKNEAGRIIAQAAAAGNHKP